MDLKYLYTFKKITETGSLKKAAEQLNYAQSTVTFQMQQLEAELHIKLFDRIGRKMVLSAAAKDILPYINNVLSSVEQLENCTNTSLSLSGTLKAAMPETLLTYQMQNILKEFREKAPDVFLNIQALNCYEIRDRIANGEFDLGIHYDVSGYSDAMIVEKLGFCHMVLIGSCSLEEEQRDFLTAGQRKKACLIANDQNSIYQKSFDAYLKRKEIEMPALLKLGGIEAVKRSAASNLGVAYLPDFAVEQEIQRGEVIRMKTDMDTDKTGIVCTYHKNKWITPAMELFIRLLRENYKSGIRS